MLGRSETGKTHLARRVWAWLLSRPEWRDARAMWSCEYSASWVYWPRQVDAMREGNFGLVRDMARWPFLVLDDIGAERDPNGFSCEKLNTLLGQRVGKWTVITGNLGFADVARMDERLASRMTREGSMVFDLSDVVPFGARKAKR